MREQFVQLSRAAREQGCAIGTKHLPREMRIDGGGEGTPYPFPFLLGFEIGLTRCGSLIEINYGVEKFIYPCRKAVNHARDLSTYRFER